MNPSVVAGEHADVYVERAVVRWLAELVGFPHEPGAGLLTSGASVATIVCFAGARGRALATAGHDVRADGLAGAPQLVAYVPSEAHSCVRRALELLGIGSGAMRDVPLDRGRLDATALRASIAADRADGFVPALLVGSAGTVNTGAIDPLAELAEVAAEERIWFHVDGAYGAFGVLDPSIAARFSGMARADSLTLDPHKWLGVPVDAGCALVRRGNDLRDVFSLIPPYLRQDADAEVGTFAEYGVEQTRPFRALKTWATIAARGRAGIAAQVQHANALARELAAMVDAEPELELAAAPRPRSSPSARAPQTVRPTGSTSSTAGCPRPFRLVAAPSSREPCSTVARPYEPASCIRGRAPSTLRRSCARWSRRRGLCPAKARSVDARLERAAGSPPGTPAG